MSMVADKIFSKILGLFLKRDVYRTLHQIEYVCGFFSYNKDRRFT